MYKFHFGLRENPFNITPDPRYIYLSDQHEDALLQLLYGIQNKKGFLMVTGEVGTGKTLIGRTLLERLNGNTETALLLNPYLNESELLKAIIDDFGIECDNTSLKDMIDAINDFLLELKKEGKNAAIIIDEAQNLSVKAMELIRMLSNLETNTEKLLQIVLIGQPELVTSLHGESLRQLNQRIAIRAVLKPLSIKDTKGYIAHRLSKAGAIYSNIFTGKASREVFNFTKGYPRLINSLCDRALLCAYSHDKKNVDKKTVIKAASDVIENMFMRRGVNYYKYAFYTLFFIFCFALITPAVINTYLKLDKKIMMRRVSPMINKGKTRPVSKAIPVNTATNEASPVDIKAKAAYEARNKAVAEALNEQEEEKEEEVIIVKVNKQYTANIVKGENGHYLSNDPSYSLETSLLNLLAIWQEDDETLKRIQKFDKPSPSFDFLIAKLGHYDIDLKSGYKIIQRKTKYSTLRRLEIPAILALRTEDKVNSFSYVLGLSYGKSEIKIIDPKEGPKSMSLRDFKKRYLRDAIIMYKSPFTTNRSLRLNTVASDVVVLEEGLKKLGYFNEEPDTTFDEQTFEAVLKLQIKRGLKPDGKVGNETKLALIKEINKPLLERSD